MSKRGLVYFRDALACLGTAKLRIKKASGKIPGIEATSGNWPDEQDVRLKRKLISVEKNMAAWLAIEEFELKEQPGD